MFNILIKKIYQKIYIYIYKNTQLDLRNSHEVSKKMCNLRVQIEVSVHRDGWLSNHIMKLI